MKLIKVEQLGFGLDGKTLDLVIAIPQGSSIKSWYICTHKEVIAEKDIKVNSLIKSPITNIPLFEQTSTSTYHSLPFDVYKLNSSYINDISLNDLIFITLELDNIPSGYNGDSLVTIALYNLLPLRLETLSLIRPCKCGHSIPSNFIDKLLQIKVIELSIKCEDFILAAIYWQLFFKGFGNFK